MTDVAPSKNAVYDKVELLAPKANPVLTGTTKAGNSELSSNVLSININGSGDRYAYIDLYGDDTYDPALRIIRANTGANGGSIIQHRGTGNFVLQANEAGNFIIQTLAGIYFQTNGANTRMFIDSSGLVTMNAQPQFSAYVTSVVSDVTGDGTIYSLAAAIWTEIADRTSNLSNGTFTAPGAAKYLLCGVAAVTGLGAGFTSMVVSLVTSNRTYVLYSSGITPYIPFSIIADMDASDTAYLTIQVSGSTKTIDINTDTRLMGYLLA